MSDVSRVELQETLDSLCKYLRSNRNYIAQELYREMHRSDCLGNYGNIYAHNNVYDFQIRLHRKRKEEE